VTDETLRALLADTGPILLDFDGPVTALLPPGPNAEVAAAAREPLIDAAYELPPELMASTDHIAVLRFAAGADVSTRQLVEDVCRELEVKAAQHSQPTVGTADFLAACQSADRPVVIVSNNDEAAIDTYLVLHGLRNLVRTDVGRPRGHPELMKPHPEILRRALASVGANPQDALMIGDAVSDVEASHAAGVRIVGYAKTPRRAAELVAAGADAVTKGMRNLTVLIGDSVSQRRLS
jgi:HAD superfamily hydrolase (TIGR01549 family)